MKRTLDTFEVSHGQEKIKALRHAVEIERAKVESLADRGENVLVEKVKENELIFGITGDRHAGSLYANTAALKAFYAYAKTQGVKVVYDCGDVLDGHKIYKGQEFELRDVGFEAQIARLKKDSINCGIETKFITGNHDASFKNLAGVSVGKAIQSAVSHFEFLGEEQARIEYRTPKGKFSIMLLHPSGGSSYAISYKPQKIIESLEGGTKPNLLAIGHFHKAEMIPSYRNVMLLQCGTFERQTPFMARGGLAAHVGGWIIRVNVGNKNNIFNAEFVAFYN